MKPPEWVPDAIFYQIFPDRFRNGNPFNDPDGTRPWSDLPPTPTSFYGGDLEGILEGLDHIQEIGANAIYLTPIFKAPSNHKYDTEDYFTVDPHFGGNEAFKELVEEIHSRGMKILLDGVFNHCGERFFAFQDVLKNGKASRYWEWFEIEDHPIRREPEPNYRCWAGVPTMPEFNTDNVEVREYLLGVVEYWLEEYGIDGWRLDTVEYLEPSFVRDIRKTVKGIREDAYVLGEVVGIAASWFKGGGYLDGVMNYKLWEVVVDFFAKGSIDAEVFDQTLRFIRLSYPRWANMAMYNLIGSHDRPRFMTLAGSESWRVELALSFLFTYIGSPAIFYGDEIGMEGKGDPDCRRPFPWDRNEWNLEIMETVRKLSGLRKSRVSLRRGDFISVHASGGMLVYLREYRGESTLVALNVSDEDSIVRLGDLRPGRILMGDGGTSGGFLEIPARSFTVWNLEIT